MNGDGYAENTIPVVRARWKPCSVCGCVECLVLLYDDIPPTCNECVAELAVAAYKAEAET